MFETIIFAGIGNFMGTCGRYLTGAMAKKIFGNSFPMGTLFVNLAGCFIIGVFYSLWGRLNISAALNALLITGFCGGLTTFSAFSLDNYNLLRNRQFGKFITYVLLSLLMGMFMVWLGMNCFN